ncbi:MAG: lipase family protein [Prochlorothrix sp.]
MNTPLTAHLDPSYRHFNFQSHIQGRYDIRNSVSLALACHLAYRTEAEVTAQAQAWGFPRVKFLEDKVVGVDTQAFVMGNAETVIVAFRGTESSTDWRTDLNFPKVDAMFGKVHKGFRSALEAVIDDVLGAVAEMRDQDQDLWITGHSLGAALATLTTAFYRHQRQTVNGLYTFGSPRVGDNRFDRFFEPDFGRHSFRVVNGNDIVTRVPPRSFGFHHVGTCVFFDGDGDWQVNPGPRRAPRLIQICTAVPTAESRWGCADSPPNPTPDSCGDHLPNIWINRGALTRVLRRRTHFCFPLSPCAQVLDRSIGSRPSRHCSGQ